MSRLKTLFFVLAAILLPVLVVLVGAAILGYYGLTMDVLSALVAAATVELGVLAGLQDRIRGWLSAPELDISILLEPPDCHQVPAVTREIGGAAPQAHSYPVYYYRLRISNKGESSAERVEVMLTKVYLETNGRFELDKSFPASNLNWATIPGKSIIIHSQDALIRQEIKEPAVYCDSISPGTYKYCALGHFWHPEHRNEDEYGIPPFEPERGKSSFCFDVSFISNLKYYHRRKGTYGVEIQVAASNAKTKTKRFKLTLNETWSDEEETMLREGLKIKQVHYDFEKYVENAVSKEQVSSKPEAGAIDKEKPPAKTTPGSQQPSASGATLQTSADQNKKEEIT